MTSDNNRNGLRAESSVQASSIEVPLANSSLDRSVQVTSSLRLGDIMDCDAIQTMMEHFYKLTNIGIGVLDIEGNVLVGVGWQDICTKFHRTCSESLSNCIESDVQLSRNIPAGTFRAYHCKNHMWEMMTPIFVDGRHLGNVCLGQFFFDDEVPDYELFRTQACRYGYDETEYLAALDGVPRWSRDTVDAAMTFYAQLAEMISTLGYGQLKLANSLSEHHSMMDQLSESEAKLLEAQEIARIGRWELDLATNNLDWSAGIYSLCEKDADSFTASFEHFIEIIHPDDRALVSDVYYDSVKNKTHYELEHRLLMPDGRIKWVIEIGRTEYDAAGNAVRSIGTVQDITDRKIQEEALQESNLRFRTLFKNVDTVAVQGYAPDGTTRYWNAASERLYGYSAHEAIGQNLLDLIIPSEMHDGVKQALQHMAQTGEAIPASELALRRKDGSIVPVYSSHTLVKVPGRETEMYCLDIDMTERKQIEGVQNFLAQTSSGTTDEPFFQTLARYLALSLGMDFVCIDRLEGGGLDARTVAVWCDGHFEDNVSYALKDTPCGDVLGQKVCCFPASVCQFFPRDQVLQDLRAESYVGVTVWNHLGQPIGLIAVIGRRPLQNRKVVEATLELVALRTAGELERLETEEALKQSDEQFRTLASLAPVGIYLTGPDGNCTYANPAWCKMAGLSLEEVRGQGWISGIHPEDRDLIVTEWNNMVQSNGKWGLEYRFLTKEGKVTLVHGLATPQYDEQGNITRYVGVNLDITERKRSEEALKRSEAGLRQAQMAARMGSWIWHVKTNELEWSDGMYQVFGICKEDFTGNLTDVIAQTIHPDDRWIVNQANRRVVSEGIHEPAEYRVVWPDKSVHVIRAQAGECTLNDAGQVVTLSGYAQDITESKQAEAAIRESERNYREIFDATADAILIRDADTWQIVDVNKSMLLMYGYDTKDEVRRLQSGDLSAGFSPYSQADVNPQIQLAREGNTAEFEWLSKKKNGELFFTEVTMRSSQIGGKSRILVTIRDISRRKQAELELKEGELAHRALVESLPDIVIRFDRQIRQVYVSSNISSVLGIPVSDCIGKTPRELGLPAEQCLFWEQAIGHVFDSGQLYETEFLFEGTRGMAVYDCRLVPEMDVKGVVHSVLSLNRDITAQRRAEEDYKTLFQQMQTGFALHEIICDEIGDPVNYRFLAVNKAFERMVGMTADELVGLTVLDVMPHTEQGWIDIYGKVALTGEPAFFENYAASIQKYFEVTAFQPAPNQFACIVADITERKQTEEEKAKLEETLQQALKMESVGRLAGGVAHDFNNMLGVILGNAQMAMEQLDPDQPLYADLKEIQAAASRSADLTRQLLAFARKQTILPKVLNLNTTIDSCLKMLERLIGEDIHLKWVPGSVKWSVKADPSQIDQMLANLCVNARDAISDVGEITIKTGTAIMDDSNTINLPGSIPGKYVWFSVSDNGCGMDQQTLAQIFEPFYTTKGVGEGTGLGLSTVYGAVQQNSGFIDVHSEPGAGTTFTIYLPRYVGEDCINDDHKSKPVERGHETILIVEDEPAILRMTTTMLQRMGYTVVGAPSPNAAISMAESYDGDIHLLLTDVVMPEMNGSELAKRLKPIYPNMQCLFMSGYTSDMIAHHGKLDDGVLFIQKPFAMHDLGSKIREALD